MTPPLGDSSSPQTGERPDLEALAVANVQPGSWVTSKDIRIAALYALSLESRLATLQASSKAMEEQLAEAREKIMTARGGMMSHAVVDWPDEETRRKHAEAEVKWMDAFLASFPPPPTGKGE